MAAALHQVPITARWTDIGRHRGQRVRAEALQTRGSRRESVRRAPALPAAPTAFPGLSAVAVSGGRPSQPDNSRHSSSTGLDDISHCFARQMTSGTSFAPTPATGAAFCEATSWKREQLPRCSLNLCAATRLPPRAAHIFFSLSQLRCGRGHAQAGAPGARFTRQNSLSRHRRSWPRS
jgi:hypothetical protein